MTRRTLAIGLDGYEPSIAEELIRAGRMPNLARLRERSARFELEHGAARRTGLAWEHVSQGRSPEASERFAIVYFDPQRYEVVQRGSIAAPALAGLDLRAVVFDAPYFDLGAAPNCRGLVSWGAHDPGTPLQCRPDSLAQEIEARFGAYPATPWIYGFVWPDALRARAMADALVRAVDTRAAIGRWLFAERLPEWDLALLVVSEFHSALEALWHGIDPSHPLHGLPSAAPARDGVIGVYQALDRLVGALQTSLPDARIVLFSMHGMGPNQSDVPSMLLLAELMLRAQLGRPCFVPRPEWAAAPDGIPRLGEGEEWSRAVLSRVGADERERRALRSKARAAWRRVDPKRNRRAPYVVDLGWVPAARYQPFWEQMDAFALPSFYDGRIRVNLVGRERRGRVALRDYDARCDELTRLLEECRDPRTGEPVVTDVERPLRGDPLAAGPTQADLVVLWRGAPLAFAHPRLGLIGPAPYRRTGGHTGGRGVGYLALPELAPGDYGVRSSFDVVPTLLELCGVAARGLSGESLLSLRAAGRRERADASAAGAIP